jgi:hypothetical protein
LPETVFRLAISDYSIRYLPGEIFDKIVLAEGQPERLPLKPGLAKERGNGQV